MVRVPRLELGTFRLGGGCSIHLSYTRTSGGSPSLAVSSISFRRPRCTEADAPAVGLGMFCLRNNS